MITKYEYIKALKIVQKYEESLARIECTEVNDQITKLNSDLNTRALNAVRCWCGVTTLKDFILMDIIETLKCKNIGPKTFKVIEQSQINLRRRFLYGEPESQK